MPHTVPLRSAAARTPVPIAGHCRSVPPQETLKHSKAGLVQSLVGITALFPGSWWAWGFVCTLWASLAVMRFDSKSCWDFFALGHRVSFFCGIQHSPVDGCSAVSCNFGVLSGEDEHTSFYSAILRHILIPACNSSSPAFLMYSAYRLSKQGDSRQLCHIPFSILNQWVVPYRVLTLAKIKLITFFVAKDGEAIYGQQKQYLQLPVAQIISFS